MTPRELVEKTFIDLGFANENPSDLDMIAELLEIWRTNQKVEYTAEQYVLLNDPDVLEVLTKCKQYYEPKKALSKADLRQILEDIATGSLKRKGYDYKSGLPTEEEPSFGERITAIKLLSDNANDNTKDTIQFINDIGFGELVENTEEVADNGSGTEEA